MVIIRPDAQACQNNLRTAFQIVAAAMFKLGLYVAIARKQFGHFIFFQRLTHGRFHLPNLQAEPCYILGSGHDLLKRRAAGHGADILRKIAANNVACFRYFSGIELFFAHDQTKDTCFTSTVWPD